MLSCGSLQTCRSCRQPVNPWPGSSLGFLGLWHQLDFVKRIHRLLEQEEKVVWQRNRSRNGQEARGGEAGLAVSLGVRKFSPEQLSVKVVGRKVLVSGRWEERREEGADGCCSYRREEFEREYALPEGVDEQALSCSLSHEGVLHIQAPLRTLAAGRERIVSISLTPHSATPAQPSPDTQRPAQEEEEDRKKG
uniref:Heat shock protein beta-11 n=1 Tax=Callorhinchus milii TaxID=7868 RepID=V9L6Y8_CALMI